jgi:hypothetical protein
LGLSSLVVITDISSQIYQLRVYFSITVDHSRPKLLLHLIQGNHLDPTL